ncbi:MAG: SBBP repeat-containing protein [Nostoc sp.]|uniref:DUF7948 domain-containing protein n=1 Tax=Nostoc sp. TaxID=1180 RepID=UPI002FF89DD2
MKIFKKVVTGFCLLLLLLTSWNQEAFANGQLATSKPTNTSPIISTYGKLPLSFQPNYGQTDHEVKFLSRGDGYTLFLTQSSAVLALSDLENTEKTSLSRKTEKSTQIKLQWLDSNPDIQPTAVQPLPGRVNYFIGNDPQQWHQDIPTYAQVKYSSLYPGIDLVYYGNQGQLEYDLVVAPGADPNLIKLKLEGAQQLEIDDQGQLLVHTSSGVLQQHKPIVYQVINGHRQLVEAKYLVSKQQSVEIALANYDHHEPLVIDPVLVYSTYLGGSKIDSPKQIAVDVFGSAYIVGETRSVNFPTSKKVYQSANSGFSDVFITKLNPQGDYLVYSTYLGGNNSEYAGSIAVDALGNAYVSGTAFSANFPTSQKAFQTKLNGGSDTFITKLNPQGNKLVYSTYLGGSGDEASYGIAVDPLGSTYITGTTTSNNFPLYKPFQNKIGGGLDVFVTKLNPLGNALYYSTYVGGSSDEVAIDIDVNTLGNAYITGFTTSNNFPLYNALLGRAPGKYDGFVTKLNVDGNRLAYSTYLGGSNNDYGISLAVDNFGFAYVVGSTASTDFPLNNPLQNWAGGKSDVFVTKVDLQGNGLIYSTYLGGSDSEVGRGIAVDNFGNAYITGDTSSNNFPVKNALQNTYGGNGDAFVTQLSFLGNKLVYSTYLGGSASERGTSIAFKPLYLLGNAVYVTGFTDSTNFPIKNAFQKNNNGSDGFVTKILN